MTSPAPTDEMVLVPRASLLWWAELASINPQDLPARIHAALSLHNEYAPVTDGEIAEIRERHVLETAMIESAEERGYGYGTSAHQDRAKLLAYVAGEPQRIKESVIAEREAAARTMCMYCNNRDQQVTYPFDNKSGRHIAKICGEDTGRDYPCAALPLRARQGKETAE